MFKLSIFATTLSVSLCPFFSGCAGARTTAEEPEEALAVALKLLETRDRSGFVERFMPPARLEKLKQRHETDDLDQIADALIGHRMEDLLREFILVKDTKPDFNDMRSQATFSANGADGKLVVVKFTLIDGKWYCY